MQRLGIPTVEGVKEEKGLHTYPRRRTAHAEHVRQRIAHQHARPYRIPVVIPTRITQTQKQSIDDDERDAHVFA